MLLPIPNKDESREDFMIRFMETKSMIEEYPDIRRRAAICTAQFNANNGEDRRHMLSFKLAANVPTRIERMDGETYVVAPVVLLVEGVHNGSGGPMYYAPEVLAESPGSWNGRPIPVLHPYSESGEPISCNSPEIIEQQSVGQLFNVIYEEGKLKGEAWINQRKARAIQSNLIEDIQNGVMEVSTGFMSNDFMMPGVWNGEEYIGAVRNIRPDHLALLPEGEGACSIEDGCGIRANKESSLPVEVEMTSKDKNVVLSEKLKFKVETMIANELSYEEIQNELQRWSDTLDDDFFLHYVYYVFDSYFVYRVVARQSMNEFLIKRSYSVDENDKIVIADDPEEVRRVVTFEPINSGNDLPLSGANVKGGKMPDKKTNDKCCEEEIQMLIENESTSYTEDDRLMLQGASEELIAKMVESLPTENTDDPDKKKTVVNINPDKKEPEKDQENQAATFEEVLANSSPEVQDMLTEMQSTHEEKRGALIAGIVANDHNQFTEDELKGKPTRELEGLYALAQPDEGRTGNENDKPHYLLQGSGPKILASEKQEALVIPSYLDKDEKKIV